MKLAVAVFSYNRGDYLRNCLESLRRNMPFAEVTVYDDHSDDPATLAYLGSLRERVVQPPRDKGTRHGGLYANMQASLAGASSDMLLFLQEDMQVVRPVSERDVQEIAALFDASPDRAFVSPAFIKGLRRRRYLRGLMPCATPRSYVSRNHADRLAYFDVAVAHVARLRAADWRFAASEHANVLQAREAFGDMPVMAEPFVFYCPEVPIFRNRGRSLASRMAARLTGPDVKAFADMTDAEMHAFRARPLDRWPVAEDFLHPLNPRVRRPFVYADVRARWWLRVLHKLEQALKR